MHAWKQQCEAPEGRQSSLSSRVGCSVNIQEEGQIMKLSSKWLLFSLENSFIFAHSSAASADLNQTSFITRFYDFPSPQSQLEGLSGINKGSILPAASILLFLKMSLGQLLKQLN